MRAACRLAIGRLRNEAGTFSLLVHWETPVTLLLPYPLGRIRQWNRLGRECSLFGSVEAATLLSLIDIVLFRLAISSWVSPDRLSPPKLWRARSQAVVGGPFASF